MAKLPKSIIKRYGISKKAWQVFRSGRSSGTKKATVNTMARKKHSFRKSKAGHIFGNMNIQNKIMSFGYGMVREQVSMMNPLKNYLGMFGKYTDEAAVLVGAEILKYVMKNQKPLLNHIQDLEMFRAGMKTRLAIGSNGSSNDI